MIVDNSTPLYIEVLLFVFVGVPFVAAMWGWSIIVAGINNKLATRHMRRQMGRWQTTFFRGKRPLSAWRAEPDPGFFRFFRGFLAFLLLLWAGRIGWRILETVF